MPVQIPLETLGALGEYAHLARGSSRRGLAPLEPNEIAIRRRSRVLPDREDEEDGPPLGASSDGSRIVHVVAKLRVVGGQEVRTIRHVRTVTTHAFSGVSNTIGSVGLCASGTGRTPGWSRHERPQPVVILGVRRPRGHLRGRQQHQTPSPPGTRWRLRHQAGGKSSPEGADHEEVIGRLESSKVWPSAACPPRPVVVRSSTASRHAAEEAAPAGAVDGSWARDMARIRKRRSRSRVHGHLGTQTIIRL